MAHNLAEINGRVAMMYQGATPWHKLGTRVQSCTNVAEALKLANLDWNVAPQPLYLADGREVDRKAIVRDIDGAILGTAGPGYVTVQNADAFGILQDACDALGVTIESAGALGIGARVFMLAKLPGDGDAVRAGDIVRPYFAMETSHDGTRAISAVNTGIRWVCQNTVNASGTHRDITIRHTASAHSRLAEAQRMVENLAIRHAQSMDAYRALDAAAVSPDDMRAFAERIFPAPVKVQPASAATLTDLLQRPMAPLPSGPVKLARYEHARDAIEYLFTHGQGQRGATGWDAYNAVTEYVDHVSVSTQTGALRKNGPASALFGSGAELKQDALSAALDMFAPAFAR